MIGLSTEPKVVGRELESGETDRERESVCVCVRQSIAENEKWHGQ